MLAHPGPIALGIRSQISWQSRRAAVCNACRSMSPLFVCQGCSSLGTGSFVVVIRDAGDALPDTIGLVFGEREWRWSWSCHGAGNDDAALCFVLNVVVCTVVGLAGDG